MSPPVQLLLFSLIATCWANRQPWDTTVSLAEVQHAISKGELAPATSPEKKQSLSETVAFARVASEGPEPVRVTPAKAQHGIGSGDPAKSPEPKQPLSETVAKMFYGNSGGKGGIDDQKTSLAETLRAEGSACAKRVTKNAWVKTSTQRLGKGTYAEVWEVKKYAGQSKDVLSPAYALKKAITTDNNRNVEAEAKLLFKIHEAYRKEGFTKDCPNVVPIIDMSPCVYDLEGNLFSEGGAYVTIKMASDLHTWKSRPHGTCRGREGKDVFRQQLLDGLKCLHVYGGFAHQDIKDDNVLYDTLNADDGCPDNLYIADLGLAEPLGIQAGFYDAAAITQSGHLVLDVISTSNLDIQVPKQRKYVVSERIDYCSLLFMVLDTFGWGIFIPGYDTPKTSKELNCGRMGKKRDLILTGGDR